MEVIITDGGRRAAGFRGDAGDCVTRAVTIASGRPYAEVYAALAAGTAKQRRTKHGRNSGKRTARNGISVTRQWFKDYMDGLGFVWVPTMQIGSGCRVHLADGELPMGRLVVSVSKHYTAVIDGVIHDTHDPQREESSIHHPDGTVTIVGGRCVYGYWKKAV
jgi:hypothetical protein